MAEGTFATVINCMDGRTQLPLIEWAKDQFGVDHVDMITEPGPDGILANGPEELIRSIRDRVLISVEKHGSGNVVLVSHHDCAGNPVSKEEHMDHLSRSMDLLRSWKMNATLFGVWVGDDWKVVRIS